MIEQAIRIGKLVDPTKKNSFARKGKDTEGGCQDTYPFYR
jgi:hypothetical protein